MTTIPILLLLLFIISDVIFFKNIEYYEFQFVVNTLCILLESLFCGALFAIGDIISGFWVSIIIAGFDMALCVMAFIIDALP